MTSPFSKNFWGKYCRTIVYTAILFLIIGKGLLDLIDLSVIKDLSRAKKYQKNNVFLHHSTTPEMYIILTGTVGIYLNHGKRNEELFATIGSGSVFNETAFINNNARFTAVALKDVIVLPISQNTLPDFIKCEPEMTLELLKEFSYQLFDINAEYERQTGYPWVNTKTRQSSARLIQKNSESLSAITEQNGASSLSESVHISEQKSTTLRSVSDEHIAAHFSLFPDGHGRYHLPLCNDDKSFIMNKSYTCPICEKNFKALKVKSSKLFLDTTDSDFRNRYKGIEPLHYDIVTCPACLFSALNEIFDKPDKTRASLPIELKTLRHNSDIKFGANIDTYSIFAGYYLALICAPNFFLSHHMITARLLMKLSWLYADCKDKEMESKTINRSLDAFLYVYEHIKIIPYIEKQVCLIIGELLLKHSELRKAKDFFFKAKTNHAGGRALNQHAENRLLYIREMMNKE